MTADLAPFLLAAPSGEVEMFLATQLVDEARHAAFFDRFGAEVMALDGDDLRARACSEMEEGLLTPWREVFDDGLRETAEQLKARPDDLDLFVEGIATYHMVVEGVPGRDRPEVHPRVVRRPRDVPGLRGGLRAGGARRAPPHRLRHALPQRRDRRGPALPPDDRGRGARAGPQGGLRVRAALRRRRRRTSSATATTRRRSTATRTPRSSAAWRCSGSTCRRPRS